MIPIEPIEFSIVGNIHIGPWVVLYYFESWDGLCFFILPIVRKTLGKVRSIQGKGPAGIIAWEKIPFDYSKTKGFSAR